MTSKGEVEVEGGFLDDLLSEESLAKMFAEEAEYRQRLRAGRQCWGVWRFDPVYSCLVHTGDVPYTIDLRRCGELTEVADWLLHMREKPWVTPALLGDLTMAFCDLLEPLMRDGGEIPDVPVYLHRLMYEGEPPP